jgi:hypothetical protein
VPSALPSLNTGQFLLERVSPAVRMLLVKEKIRAMEGYVDEALRTLEDAVKLVENDRPRDIVALGMLMADLMRLELRSEDALATMKRIVTPHLSSLTPEERFGVEQNLSDVLFPSHPAGYSLFYNIVDQKHLVKFEWLDYRDLFSAMQDAEGGDHFKTLPILWQQHRRAYLHGCWVAQRWTHGFLAKECIHLKEWQDAVHHVIFAPDDKLVTEIAEGVLSARSVTLVDQVVNRLLTTANLQTHFVVACKLLRELGDGIPDAWISKVGAWLLKRGQESRNVLIGVNPVLAAWETISCLAHRFSIDQARSTIKVALAHPIWTTKSAEPNRVIVERKTVVRVLVPLSKTLPPNEIPPLADAVLPLLTDRPQSYDYNDVVNLLCHLAETGGVNVRDSLAISLYPPGQPVSRILTQVADVFGKAEIFDHNRLQKLAEKVTQEIRRQVQWLKPGQIAEPPAEQIMEYNNPKSDGTLKVYVTGLAGLHALAKHRTKLDKAETQNLVNAILDLVRHKDNFCVNREALLYALIRFADAIDAPTRNRIVAALEPIAKGEVEESSEYPTASETHHPLNPFKSDSGRPEDVQSMALIALATFASRNAVDVKRVGKILEDALCDQRPGIRRAGYAAAWRLPNVSEGVVLAILSGLRDPDPNAAGSAFAALANQGSWTLKRDHWRVFLMAARMANRTGGPDLRRYAGSALAALSSKCPRQFKTEQTELIAKWREDICWSVRNAANGQDAAHPEA